MWTLPTDSGRFSGPWMPRAFSLQPVMFLSRGQTCAATVSLAKAESFSRAVHCAQDSVYITSFYPKSILLKQACSCPVVQTRKLWLRDSP